MLQIIWNILCYDIFCYGWGEIFVCAVYDTIKVTLSSKYFIGDFQTDHMTIKIVFNDNFNAFYCFTSEKY